MATRLNGGYQVSAEDQILINEQRAITKEINDKFIQVGALFLKASSKNPFDEEGWMNLQHKDTRLQDWIDDPDLSTHNVGFNLQQGWVDIDIDGPDPEFNRAILSAMDHLKIDRRFQFGRKSVGFPTHVMVQLGEEESANFDKLAVFEPKPFKIKDERYHVNLRSFPTNITGANLVRSAKQTVMPGSIYSHKKRDGEYDISVWYANGVIAKSAKNIASTTPRRVNFNELVRAIAFGTFAYVMKNYWTEGSRQMAAQKVCGWLARVVTESQAMNNHEAISADVFCPIDTDDIAESLIDFFCSYVNDDEKHMRKRVFRDSRKKLERNPDAMIPGWPSIQQMVGGENLMALRNVLTPGSDVSVLSKLAERYVYDETDNRYIDRVRFVGAQAFTHEGSDLERRHRGDFVRVGGKVREAFRIFEASDMRKRVGFRDLHPDLAPGGIYRINSMGEIVNDEEDGDETTLSVFNTWRGWPVRPAPNPDPELVKELVAKLDKLLGYLTRDNAKQIDWIKKWLAWTFQNPGTKQQIAWVVVGGQGVGKSFFGNIFMKQLMGNLWGTASPKILEGDFNIAPFKDKMFVFIDEAKFGSEAGVDEVKKLVRNIEVPGTEKFMESRTYNIYARLMFASNRFDINVGQTNTNDRALFYTKAYDKDYLEMDELTFRAWAEGLKPWFDEFMADMQVREIREHFMHYFMTLETSRHEIESIRHSSGNDPSIVVSNMSWARRIAKAIIEDGRVFEDLEITMPFTNSDLFKRVADVATELGLRSVQGERVLNEFKEAGVIETVTVKGQRKMRFKYRLGELHVRYGQFISLPLEPRFEFTDADFGENTCDGIDGVESWRGLNRNRGMVNGTRF